MLMPSISDLAPARLRVYRSARKLKRDAPDQYSALFRLANRAKASIDVGANRGSFTYYMRTLSTKVCALEPNPDYIHMLRGAFNDVRIIQAAASDAEGQAVLRIPKSRALFGRATIEATNDLQDLNLSTFEVTVPTLPLDSLGLTDIGFMKIDVEGHELAVLKGARDIIARDRPNLLIEAESRHRPDAFLSVLLFLMPYDYVALTLVGGKLSPVPISEQNGQISVPDEETLGTNNYVFVQRDKVASL